MIEQPQNPMQFLSDTDRRHARKRMFNHCVRIELSGHDLYDIGKTLLSASCHTIKPTQTGLMMHGADTFIGHMRDTQHHVKDMIEYLDKRLHLTDYIFENDELLMRHIEQFENVSGDPGAETFDNNTSSVEALIQTHISYADIVIRDTAYRTHTVANTMQEAAVVCLALSPMPRHRFQVILKMQKRRLKYLYQSVKQCRQSAENMINTHFPEKDKMNKTTPK